MTNYPDLSLLHDDVATDGLVKQMFVVNVSEPKSWEQEMPKPSRSIELQDGSWAHIWGEGPPILFVHGYDGRYSQVARILEKLSGSGFKLVALEMPGHGRSHAYRADVLAFSHAVRAASRVFGPFHAIIGHSLGANVVLHAVANGAKSDNLVLIAPLISIEAHLREVCAMVKLSPDGTDVFIRKMTAQVGAPPSDFDGRVLRSSLHQPTFVIHDREDREMPFADTEDFVAGWPSAHLYASEGLGHKRLLADDSIANMIYSFLDQTVESKKFE
ncbi:MAG: alpha/beta fold hydrolase [Acidimicrobiales bacterium]